MSKEKREISKRTGALLWMVGVGLVIGVLIYLQMIPLLYVLATLAIVILLFIVAFADLKDVDKNRTNDPA